MLPRINWYCDSRDTWMVEVARRLLPGIREALEGGDALLDIELVGIAPAPAARLALEALLRSGEIMGPSPYDFVGHGAAYRLLHEPGEAERDTLDEAADLLQALDESWDVADMVELWDIEADIAEKEHREESGESWYDGLGDLEVPEALDNWEVDESQWAINGEWFAENYL